MEFKDFIITIAAGLFIINQLIKLCRTPPKEEETNKEENTEETNEEDIEEAEEDEEENEEEIEEDIVEEAEEEHFDSDESSEDSSEDSEADKEQPAKDTYKITTFEEDENMVALEKDHELRLIVNPEVPKILKIENREEKIKKLLELEKEMTNKTSRMTFPFSFHL